MIQNYHRRDFHRKEFLVYPEQTTRVGNVQVGGLETNLGFSGCTHLQKPTQQPSGFFGFREISEIHKATTCLFYSFRKIITAPFIRIFKVTITTN